MNEVLCACVQELAIENGTVRRECAAFAVKTRLRRPALRRRHCRRLRGALPRAGRAPREPPRHHRADDVRSRLCQLGERRPRGHDARTGRDRAAFPRGTTPAAQGVCRSQRRSLRRALAPRAAGRVVPRKRARDAGTRRAPAFQRPRYDAVAFWAYRYAPTYFGLPLVAERAVLVPTAEDDRAIDLDVLGEFFRLPAGYIFLTPEEEALVSTRAGRTLRPSSVIGSGLDAAQAIVRGSHPRAPRSCGRLRALSRPRDRNKGCDGLLEYFQEFAARPDAPTLVLAGPATMRIPDHPKIRALGFVPDELRDALLVRARAMIVPSPYESLSIALLQAEPRGAGARQRPLPGARGPGSPGERRARVSLGARVPRVACVPVVAWPRARCIWSSGPCVRGTRVPLVGRPGARRRTASGRGRQT